MKHLLTAIFSILFAAMLYGREVFFIPGWYSEWINYSSHSEIIRGIFPGKEVKVRKWHSNRLWSNAKVSADEFATELAGEITSAGKPEEITLIGHSLGGRITLDCVNILAAGNFKLKQIILLGTAGEISADDIANCRKVSRLPVINIFCPEDNMLKLYIRKEHSMPLGFAGLPSRQQHFRQYRLPVSHEDIRLWQKTVIPEEAAEPFRQTAIHLAKKYMGALPDALSGKLPESYIDWQFLEKTAAADSIPPDNLPGFVTIEEFDNWSLAKRRYRPRYRLSSPSGKKFFFSDEKSARNNFEAVKKHLSGK